MSRISIIAGSQRPGSESAKVGQFISKAIDQLGSAADFIDVGANPLPLWDENLGKKGDQWDPTWTKARKTLQGADGLVIISPEWGGMASPALKNLLLLASPKELGYKPALLISVTSGRSGSYPISELRSSGYKNNKILYLPDHVIIRDVEHVLNTPPGETPSSDGDKLIRSRLHFSLEVLLLFTRSLAPLRQDPMLVNLPFPNGM